MKFDRRTGEFSLENEDTQYNDIKIDGFVEMPDINSSQKSQSTGFFFEQSSENITESNKWPENLSEKSDLSSEGVQQRLRSQLKRAISHKVQNLEMMEDGFNKGYFDVIDAENEMIRYKMCIIDFLTNYDTSKFLENSVKARVGGVSSDQISACDQFTYQDRFIKFMDKYL